MSLWSPDDIKLARIVLDVTMIRWPYFLKSVYLLNKHTKILMDKMAPWLKFTLK